MSTAIRYRVSKDNQTVDFTDQVAAANYCRSIGVDSGSITQVEVITPTLSNEDLSEIRFSNRARVRDNILMQMAMSKYEYVQSGTWTPEQLLEITANPEMRNIFLDIYMLNFELAIMDIAALADATAIDSLKVEWTDLLTRNLF